MRNVVAYLPRGIDHGVRIEVVRRKDTSQVVHGVEARRITRQEHREECVESRSEKISQELQGDATWSRPILFYPDGSAGDAFIVVGNDHNAGIRINLRGMTAAVTVEEIKDLKLLEEDTTLSK